MWRTLDRGTLRDIALVCLANSLVAVSFGAIAVTGGLPAWVPIVMSIVVFAGGAQFAALGIAMAGGGAVAAVAAGLLLNARLLPFGFAVADILKGRWWSRLIGAHLTTDESVAFALRHREPALRRASFWICAVAMFVSWNIAVALGTFAGGFVGDTAAFGLDAAFPAVLLALALPALNDRGTREAALIGAVVAVAATPLLPAGLPVLLALIGLVAAVRRPALLEAETAEGAVGAGRKVI
ncbi:AzlC family ABC transporter permease [Sinosporangium siamense]|uniref:Branched-chain amino acid ABC transporter permease n=2 Tax=Sinosporangium siamense TaxID=1367973 RepID=A0A919VFA9_9ACTN|nr:AzlC family ABC transporter permease [Sinosporangium siamense]GII95944.1 branched-chain amino acid ABC transporter permease [Sinosporangium siamense]